MAGTWASNEVTWGDPDHNWLGYETFLVVLAPPRRIKVPMSDPDRVRVLVAGV